MRRTTIELVIALSTVIGCSTPYVLPELGPTHPASASAPETPLPPASLTLAGEPLPPPEAKEMHGGHRGHGR